MEASATGQQAMDRDQEAVHDCHQIAWLIRSGRPARLAPRIVV